MSDFLLPEEEGRMKQDALRPSPLNGSPFLLPGERTAAERAEPVLRSALQTDPDAEASTRRVARTAGLPEAVASRNMDRATLEARIAELQSATKDSNPALLRKLTDERFAKVAHDDIDNLANIGGVVAAPRGPERAVTNDEFARMVRQTKERNPTMGWDEARAAVNARVVVDNSEGGVAVTQAPATTASTLASGALSAVTEGLGEQTRQGIRRFLGDVLGLDIVAADAKVKGQQSQVRQYLDTPKPEGFAGEAYQGALSVVQSAPGIVAAFANPALGLATFGVQTAAPAYSKYRDRGATTGEAATGALLEGGAEVLFEKAPLGFLVDNLGKVGFGRLVAGMLARDIPGELGTTIAQTAVDTAIANPNKTWGEWASELPAELRQTVVSTVMQTGVLGAVGVAARKLELRAIEGQTAENDAQALEGLSKLVASSKVLERDASSLQAYIDEAAEDGPVREVFVPASVFAQAAGDNLDVFKQLMPSVAEQFDSAIAANTDLVIPLGEFIVQVQGTGMEAALIEHVRTGVDAPSRAEAQAYMQSGAAEELRKNIEEQMARAVTSSEEQQSAAKVEAELLAQLKEVNRFTEDVNVLYARAAAAFYAATAARLKRSGKAEYAEMTAETLAQMAKLDVRAQDPGQGDAFDQNKEWQVVEGGAGGLTKDAAENIIRMRTKGNSVVRPLDAWKDREFRVVEDRTNPGSYLIELRALQPTNNPNILKQSATIRRGSETLRKFGLDPNGRYTTREVAAALEARQRVKYGVIGKDDRSPEASSKIAKWMVEEILFEMQTPGASGVGWYSEKFQNALDIYSAKFPELASDQTARDLFTLAIAVTSDGVKAKDNFNLAADVYGRYRGGEGFHLDKRVTQHPAIARHVEKLNELVAKVGADKLRDYLLQETTVGEVNKMLRAEGKPVYSDYAAKTEMPLSAVLLGPKIGVFAANLLGSHGYLTMDRWWSRTFNRYRGSLLTEPTQASFVRMRELLGKPNLSEDEVLSAAATHRASYEAKGYKDGTELEKAANTMYKLAFESLNDAPFNSGDRTFMIEVVNKAQKNLKRRGVEMSIADIQAALWYYEKRLYGELGARQSGVISYEDAARQAVSLPSEIGDLFGGPDAAGEQRAADGETAGALPGAEPFGGGGGTFAQGAAQPEQRSRNPSVAEAQAEARRAAGSAQKLVGLPSAPMQIAGAWYVPGPVGVAHEAARAYMDAAGLPYAPARFYVPVDVERAQRIAKAFDEMKHAPDDPEVKAAYRAMIDETVAQYQAIKATGLKIEFIDFDKQGDPYAESPRLAIQDVAENSHLWVFPTDSGFGSSDADISGNPLLEFTDEYIDGKRLRANDVFRVVHDYFGHIKDGNGFRAGGEENAWRSHAAMYSPLARRAMTTETRGQNSWVNYGPKGESNRTASAADTVYADQKIGLLPEWVSEEGRADPVEAYEGVQLPSYGTPRQGSISVVGLHFSTAPRQVLNTGMYGRGMKDAGYQKTMASPDKRLHKRAFFYVNEGKGIRSEKNVGAVAHAVRLNNIYDASRDPLGIWKQGGESAVLDAGFDGYLSRNAFSLGMEKGLDGQWREKGGFGTVVLLGSHGVPVSKIGFEKDANALPVSTYFQPEPPQGGNGADANQRTEVPPASSGETRGMISFGKDITKSASTITLLRNADLSTFLHELGHFQLEVLANIASQPNAPVEIVADLERVLEWFGVESIARWNSMTLEEKRPFHEQFARGFESYLFEGKAPSTELKGAFARFRSWVLAVYREITALNVQLTDEVRGVFDRLMASEEQIAEAQALRGFAPVFQSAEEMGATPEEWAEYQAQSAEATEDAVAMLHSASLRDMKWLRNAQSRTLRKMQKDAETKRKQVEDEVREEVQTQPVYAALRWLKTGVLPDGTQTVGAKLDLPALKEMYGEGPAAVWRYLSVGVQGLAGNEGLHPDQVAEMFGFTSGDHLVRTILDAQPEADVAEAMTDQRMLERYGDLATPDGLKRAVDEALHNEARARFISTELRALTRATGNQRAMTKAAKDFAAQIIARKRVREVKPAQFTAAEARAGRAAEKAKGLTEKATEKRNQLVNHYAARAAHEALSDVEKGLALFKRAVESEAIDIGYREQIDALLERFDLRSGQSLKAIDKRTALAEWIKSQEDMGFEPTISEELRNEAFRKSYKDMTVEEFRGLVDAVKNIEHLGRLKKKLLTIADAREFAAVVDELRGSIEANATGTVVERRASDRGPLVQVGKLFRNFLADHRKFASLAREMDGWKDGGRMWDYLVRSMNAAGDKEAVMREQATVKLSALMAPILKQGGLGKKTFFDKAGKSFTREEVLGIALNMGNLVNRERVTSGENLSPAALTDVLNSLSKQDWDFVQGTWDYLETFRTEIAAKERRLTGTEPEWVEAAPISTKFGVYKGGYYPIKYDPERSTRAEADTASEVQRQLERGLYTRAQTRRGHLKARIESTGRPLRYDLGVIVGHVDQVVHDLSWHEYLIDANRVLRALDIPLREYYGPEKLRAMKETLTDIAVGDLAAKTSGDRILNHLRHSATVAGLGWRVTTALLQPLGLTQSAVRIGSKWVLKGAYHWMGDAFRLENSVRLVGEKSDFMRLRAKTMQREINEIRNKVAGQDSRIEASYFLLIQKMQLVADLPTWWGQYEKTMAEEGATEAGATAMADQAVRDAQGGGQIGDLAGVQRGSAAWRLFTNFYSFFNTTYNLTRESFGRTKSAADVPALAVDLLLLYSVPALLGTLMKAALADDWDDEDKLLRRLAADQLNYLFGTIVVVREINAAVQSAAGLAGDYGGPASVRLFNDLAKLAKQTEQGEADEGFWKALNSVGGDILGYPAGQINATASGLHALATGRTDNPGALLVGAQGK